MRRIIFATLLCMTVSGGCLWQSAGKLSKAEIPAAGSPADLSKSAADAPAKSKSKIFASLSNDKKAGDNPTGDKSAESVIDPEALIGSDDETNSLVASMKTLGGKQFWADELFFHDWKIQRNCFTGHCRLLDGKDNRVISGTYDECASKLDEVKKQQNMPPMQGPCVILLHGLCRSNTAMNKMATYLRKEGHYTVFNVEYPSTQAEIEQHARGLDNIIRHLDGITEINFVGHSLGNVVVRRYLFNGTDAATGRKPDPRIHRIVMCGAPNNGAKLATTLGRMMLFRLITGSPGQELGRGFEQLQGRLATPQCEFGIIAGGKGDDKGFNPILPGDDDLIVSVAETRLPGARDFVVLPVMHTFMMDAPAVQECTLRFLQHGYFVSEEKRQPIEAEEVPMAAEH